MWFVVLTHHLRLFHNGFMGAVGCYDSRRAENAVIEATAAIQHWNDAKVKGCSCRHSGETAFVFWNGADRGHFERALPLKVILEGVFPERIFLALSEFSRSLTHSLGCTPLNWPSLGTSRSPILCLHATMDMYDKWTSFLQNEWTQMLSALPNYVKDDLRTLHRKWLSERHKTLWSLFLGKNVIDEHNRGFERSVRFRSKWRPRRILLLHTHGNDFTFWVRDDVQVLLVSSQC